MQISLGEVEDAKKEFEDKLWTMKAHYVIRQVAGQVLESLILTDRLLWLRGHCENCKIEDCLGGLSGRGFALWARK